MTWEKGGYLGQGVRTHLESPGGDLVLRWVPVAVFSL